MNTILNFSINQAVALRLVAAGLEREDKDVEASTQYIETTAEKLNIGAHELSAKRADFGRNTNIEAKGDELFFFGDLAKAYIIKGAKVVIFTKAGKFQKAKLMIGKGSTVKDVEAVMREVRGMGFQKLFVYWNPAHDDVEELVTINPANRGNYSKTTEARQIEQKLIDKLASGGKFEWEESVIGS